jgi:hypothetical protein
VSGGSSASAGRRTLAGKAANHIAKTAGDTVEDWRRFFDDLDNRIQHVGAQALKYVKMLDPTGHGLRADVACSYRNRAHAE